MLVGDANRGRPDPVKFSSRDFSVCGFECVCVCVCERERESERERAREREREREGERAHLSPKVKRPSTRK